MKKEDIGLLILRLTAGGAMLSHGWSKLLNFSVMSTQFPSLLGLSSKIGLALTVFSEVFCAFAIIIGLLTRFASIPLIITMLVAIFLVNGADPFAKKELALLYCTMFATLGLTGAGSLSIDRFINRK